MAIVHWEVLVEEQSMEQALRILLPSVLNGRTFEVYAYHGKQVLLQRLQVRLNGYRNWLPVDWMILIVVDRDDDDCRLLKQQVETIVATAGLGTRSVPLVGRVDVITRVAVEELEAWYFGDWAAVQAAYPKVRPKPSSRYRHPDEIKGGTWEAFEREMQRHGYFVGGLRKIDAARRITPHMKTDRNLSPSFQALFETLSEISRQ